MKQQTHTQSAKKATKIKPDSYETIPIDQALESLKENMENLIFDIPPGPLEWAGQGGAILYVPILIRIGDKIHKFKFSTNELVLTRGICASDNATDSRAKIESVRLSLDTSSKDAPKLYELINLVSIRLSKFVESIKSDKRFPPSGKVQHTTVPLIRTSYNKVNDLGEYDTINYEEPRISVKLDFNVYTPNYPFAPMRGKPRMTLYNGDISRPKKVGDELMYVPDVLVYEGEAINEDNAHFVFTKGTRFSKATISMDTLMGSQYGWSTHAILNNGVVHVKNISSVENDVSLFADIQDQLAKASISELPEGDPEVMELIKKQ